jgi:hypothetical protein
MDLCFITETPLAEVISHLKVARRLDRAGAGGEDRRARPDDVGLLPRSRRQPHRSVQLRRAAWLSKRRDLAKLRRDYELKTLDESQVDRDPLKQFGVWMVEAIHAQVPEPTAMTLATADAKGRPSGRIVLLKGVDPRGFVFFTNYESRKAGRWRPTRQWRSRSCGRSSSARCASREASRR